MCTMLATAIGAAGTLMQGWSQYQAGKAQARVASANAGIEDAAAHDAIERGGVEEMRLRRQMASQRGTQRAMMAAMGIDPDSGSGWDIQDASMREGERDAAAIRFNAARERWGHRVQATSYRNAASAARSAGRNALFGSAISAGGQLAGLIDWGGRGSSGAARGTEASPLTATARKKKAPSWWDDKRAGRGGYLY